MVIWQPDTVKPVCPLWGRRLQAGFSVTVYGDDDDGDDDVGNHNMKTPTCAHTHTCLIDFSVVTL